MIRRTVRGVLVATAVTAMAAGVSVPSVLTTLDRPETAVVADPIPWPEPDEGQPPPPPPPPQFPFGPGCPNCFGTDGPP